MAKNCHNCAKYKNYGARSGCNKKGFHDGKIVCLSFMDKMESEKAKKIQQERKGGSYGKYQHT